MWKDIAILIADRCVSHDILVPPFISHAWFVMCTVMQALSHIRTIHCLHYYSLMSWNVIAKFESVLL